jgi:hypothetical protein
VRWQIGVTLLIVKTFACPSGDGKETIIAISLFFSLD